MTDLKPNPNVRSLPSQAGMAVVYPIGTARDWTTSTPGIGIKDPLAARLSASHTVSTVTNLLKRH